MNITKKETILNKLKNTYCRLQPSLIDGVGVFAIKDIPPGIDPFHGEQESEWIKFKMEELKELDPEILRMINDFNVIEKDNTVLIPDCALNGMSLSFFINNSDSPNLDVPDEQAKRKEGYTFITTRTIKKGEELTVKYETFDYKYKKENK